MRGINADGRRLGSGGKYRIQCTEDVLQNCIVKPI